MRHDEGNGQRDVATHDQHGSAGRTVAVGAAAVAGAAATAAAGAALLRAREARQDPSPLPNLIGGEEGWFPWRGHRVAWTRRGQGPAMVLVHAIHAAAWSYEWRRVVDGLAASHTVWTIDLLGFGRSDRPRMRYTAALYVQLVRDFLEQQVGEPAVLVASSLSGAHAVAVAARDARQVPGLVLVCPTGVTHLASPPNRLNDVARATIEAPVVGQGLFDALVTKPSMRAFLSQTYHDSRTYVTDDLLDAYWATTHRPGARWAVASFVGMQLNLNVRDALRRLEQPLLITWGAQAKEVPRHELDAYRELRPEAEVALFEECGSLPYDEKAAQWMAAVEGFIARRVRGEAAVADVADVALRASA
ncbi:MAG TPA: alpha/beta fold hydrolase [Gemmatirosa sp.]|nr:alpha/beta fold hydrolase [Gemmatirosa sp.]